jgi:hypothetical protein
VPRPGSRLPGRPGQPAGPSKSWWTARATAGEVAPGFSKEEILKEVPPDPKAPGGVYERISGLLRELGDE